MLNLAEVRDTLGWLDQWGWRHLLGVCGAVPQPHE
jgi:hypothetical protein